MVTSVFFNNHQSTKEQETYHDLIVESLRIYGRDMYYLPKTLNNYDPVYGADTNTSYESSYIIETYVKSIDGFQGDGTFLSKFGLEIRDRVIFTVARRTFEREVGQPASILRPNEGDLVYYPENKKCFQIKFVDDKPFFYPFGTLVTYDLHCELFEYSGETINTGVEEIDNIYNVSTVDSNILNYSILTSNGDTILTDTDHIIVSDKYTETIAGENEIIEQEGNLFIDWSEKNPFSEQDVE